MRTRNIKISNRTSRTSGSSLKKLVTLFVTFIIIGIIIAGYFLIQQNELLIGSVLGDFKILTIKEAFENCFVKVNVKVGAFSPPQITGIDEMKNTFTLYAKKDGSIIININGRAVDNPYEQYKIIYEKGLFNLLRKISVEDYKNASAGIAFDYYSNYTYSYKQENGKEFIVVSGESKDGKNVLELWFLFRRINNTVKLFVEKVSLNYTVLSDLKKTAMLSELFNVDKSLVKDNLITLVKTSLIDSFALGLRGSEGLEIGNVLDSFQDARWFIKDEANNIVECNVLTKSKDVEESLVFGFKMDKVGIVSIEYAYSNGQEITQDEAYEKLYELYAKTGRFKEKEYVQRLVEKIKATQFPNSEKLVSDFISELKSSYDISWGYLIKGKYTKIAIDGATKDSSIKFRILYVISGEKIELAETYINNTNVDPKYFLPQIIKLKNINEKTDSYISKVKSSNIVPGSSFKDNASAFEAFLKNPSWSYNEKTNRVTLTGNGFYGGKNWQFKFVFELLTDKTLLEYAYANDIEMIDEIRDYIISKIFKFPRLAGSLPILVKNTIFKTKTYGKILGESGWGVDSSNDSIVFSGQNMRVTFFVEPNGDVFVKEFYYKGTDYTSIKYELLQAAEETGIYGIESLIKKQTEEKIEIKPIENKSNASNTQEEKKQDKPEEKQENEIIHQQF